MSQADIHNFNILVLAMHFCNFEQFQNTARVTFLEMTVKILNDGLDPCYKQLFQWWLLTE